MTIEVIYPTEELIPSFWQALSIVAKEKIYLEMIEAPPLAKVLEFQRKIIAMNGPVYYAVDGKTVVGWIDIFPVDNPRLAHRGGLGMGLIPSARGKGVGTELMSRVLSHAKTFGLEKVELNVYSENKAAIALYKKFGFEQEGYLKCYRKLEARYFDCVAMAKFLD
jgi:RimJ/RimL family protein N-acetyltransferase